MFVPVKPSRVVVASLILLSAACVSALLATRLTTVSLDLFNYFYTCTDSVFYPIDFCITLHEKLISCTNY